MSDTSAIETTPVLEEIKQPITDDNPCGDDVTYDDTFQQIKGMIDRGAAVGGRIDQEKALKGGDESIVSAGEGVDYADIVELSREILRSKSKDIRVTCYLALGLFHTKGTAGMAEGLAGLYRLIDRYWDDLYPAKRRARARSSAVKFLADRLDDALKDFKPAVDDRETLERSIEILELLQTFLLDELEEKAPALSSFKRTLTDLIRRVPDPVEETDEENTPDAEIAEQTEEQESTNGTVEQNEQPPPDSPTERGYERESDAHGAILQAAAFLRDEDRSSTVPYRLSRIVRWEILRSEPSHEDAMTNIPPPEDRRRSYLTGLLDKGQYAALLTEAEASFREPPFHFWLDLQRLLTAGMKALGPSYREAREVIMAEIALLARRLPQLLKLTFNDGTPFADALTRQWIEQEVMAIWKGPQDQTMDRKPEADGDHLKGQFEEALGVLAGRDLSTALKVMHEGAGEDGSKKDLFRRRLYAAALCMKGDQPTVARPILEELEEEIRRHGLAEWDPRLALNVWTDLYKCYEALANSSTAMDKQTVRERAGRVFEKICTIDPGFAVTMGS